MVNSGFLALRGLGVTGFVGGNRARYAQCATFSCEPNPVTLERLAGSKKFRYLLTDLHGFDILQFD